MNEFNEMFQNAVAIKSHEMQSKRKNFEKQPLFIKAGLYYSNEYSEQRKEDFGKRMQIAISLKDNGNQLFKKNQYSQAQHEYEKSLSIFLYIANRKPNWKNEGILDEDLTYKDESEDNEECINLRINILVNLAICYVKQKQYIDAIAACDLVLTYQQNAKAYYQRAKARVDNINADENDYKLAIDDLEKALQLENDQAIKRDLDKAKNELKKMRRADFQISKKVIKNIVNMQEQQLESSSSDEENEYEYSEDWKKYQFTTLNYEPSYKESKSIMVADEVNELGKFIETRGVQLLRCYEKNGKQGEAEKYREQLSMMMAAKVKLERICKSDFSRPIEENKASKFGIDLNDPAVKEEFRRLRDQNVNDVRKWLKEQNWKMKKQKIMKKVNKLAKKQKIDDDSNSIMDWGMLLVCIILIVMSVYYNWNNK